LGPEAKTGAGKINPSGYNIACYCPTTQITSSAYQTNGPCVIQEDVCLPTEEHGLAARLALN
jgi:hypothetical protein